MALSTALTTAISGLIGHQTAMDVIGNNLANINTTSYKSARTEFSTLLEQTISGATAADPETGRGSTNAKTMGLGVQVAAISKDHTQGALEQTGNINDLAIEGNGFFVLKQGNNNVYTRDGSFYLGSDGSLMGSSGLYVQGVMADESGIISENTISSNIVIPIGQTGAAVETSTMSMTGNIYSNLEVAAGINLVSNAIADPAASAALGATTVDTTWDALNGPADQFINGGSVQTSAAFAVETGGAPAYADAALNTDLADLFYLSGDTWVQPFQGIADGDEITMTFRRGGSKVTESFTYTTDSNTLEDLLTFMGGDVNQTATVASLADIEDDSYTETQGGIMGLLDVAGNVSTGDGGTSAYSTPLETAGAYTRTGATMVDYGAGNVNAFQTSIVSNLGTQNAISQISFSYNNVNYTDMFADDLNYGAVQGGSTSTSMVVYDSLGNAKTVNMSLVLVDRDTNFSTYRWTATSLDDTDADWQQNPAGDITTSTLVGTGLIRFDSNGNYVAGTEYSETSGISVTLEDQGVNNPINITVRNGLTVGTQNLDFSTLTQVNKSSDFTMGNQNGSAPGTLDTFTVTADGVIQGIYSNGVVVGLARVVLASFASTSGLLAASDNIYYESVSSGAAKVGFPGDGGRGDIWSGYLESSNVDMSTEFTKLITTQRGYQANARVVSTADSMLEELVNLVR